MLAKRHRHTSPLGSLYQPANERPDEPLMRLREPGNDSSPIPRLTPRFSQPCRGPNRV
jgi:hypothetical protein